METVEFKNLTPEYQKLLNLADETKHNAYAPYSKFNVGAALLTREGKTFTGCNVETAAIQGVHAETAAITAANTEGYRDYKAIAVIATSSKEHEVLDPTAPCGSCRQLINEFSTFATGELTLILSNSTKDKVILTTIDEVFPLSFGAKDMAPEIL